jgi:hypothetical protein
MDILAAIKHEEGVFRGESASSDETQQPTSLRYSPFVRTFIAIYHD